MKITSRLTTSNQTLLLLCAATGVGVTLAALVAARALSHATSKGGAAPASLSSAPGKEAIDLKISSYNVLAQEYVNPEWYPLVSPDLLANWEWRQEALIKHILELDSDIVCLQEVTPEFFDHLKTALAEQGYQSLYAQKGCGRVDGCATFYRQQRVTLLEQRTLTYHDLEGGAQSGHVALIADFEVEGRALSVANTHLRWDAQGILAETEIRELLQREILPTRDSRSWMICGDFNVTADSGAVKALEQNSLNFAGQGETCLANGTPRKIDFIFFDDQLWAKAARIQEIAANTPLPSAIQPSDHLAISTRIRFAS